MYVCRPLLPHSAWRCKLDHTSGNAEAMEVIGFLHTGALSLTSFKKTTTGKDSTTLPPLIRLMLMEMELVTCVCREMVILSVRGPVPNRECFLELPHHP